MLQNALVKIGGVCIHETYDQCMDLVRVHCSNDTTSASGVLALLHVLDAADKCGGEPSPGTGPPAETLTHRLRLVEVPGRRSLFLFLAYNANQLSRKDTALLQRLPVVPVFGGSGGGGGTRDLVFVGHTGPGQDDAGIRRHDWHTC